MNSQLSSKNMITKIVKLNNEYKYQILFMISVYIYHSTDYYFKAPHYDERNGLVFDILDNLNINLIQIALILVSFSCILSLIHDILFKQKENYLFQILEKIIFPFQIYIVIKIINNSSQSRNLGTYLWKRTLNFLIFGSTITTFFLLIIKNFKLSLRYSESDQKGLNRLYKGQFVLLLAKMGLNLLFAIFLTNQKIAYLLVLSLINALMNILFIKNVFYEHAHIEYLCLITQIYIWFPVFNGLLKCNIYNSTSISIFNALCLLAYFLVGIYKPKLAMHCLQKKYLKNILAFQRLKNGSMNQQDFKLAADESQIIIAFLTILVSLVLKSQQKNQLKWSDNFKTEFLKVLQETVLNQNKIVNGQQISRSKLTKASVNQDKSNIVQKKKTLRQMTICMNNSFLAENNQSNELMIYEQVWKFINSILKSRSHQNRSIRFFVCYNFSDVSNFMKQEFFYLYYQNAQSDSSFFDRIQSKLCYSYLLKKIGSQQIKSNTNNNSNLCNLQKKKNLKSSQFQAHASQEEDYIFCFSSSPSYYNSDFNNVVQQNQLLSSIMDKLFSFLFNQESYIALLSNLSQSKKQIRNYFSKRSTLRHQIQDLVQKYNKLNTNDGKFYINVMLSYICDFWLNQNHLIAYDNFLKTLQTKICQKKQTQNKYSYKIESPLKNDVSNVLCAVSGISSFDSIVICCSQFKRLFEIQQVSKIQLNKKQIQQSSQEANHRIQMNSFVLPLWKEKHQDILNEAKIYQKPIDHLGKRYFLLSKRRTNVFQIKFKMHLHMLFEKDLLIVLDIQQQRLESLVITNEQKDKVLFKQKRVSIQSSNLNSIYSENGRKTLNSIINNEELLNQLKSNRSFELVRLFNENYHVTIEKQCDQSQIILNQFLNFKAKSCVQFEQIFVEQQKNLYFYEQKIKQLKFAKFKSSFFIFKNKFWLNVIFYILSSILVLNVFQIYLQKQKKNLSYLVQTINEQIALQDAHGSEDFYRSIDIGMLTNVCMNQINVMMLSPQKANQLFQNIMTSMKNSIISMKERHKANAFTFDKTIKSEKYYDWDWIKSDDKSFQLHTYWNEMKYLEYAQGLIKIIQNFSSSQNQNIIHSSDNFQILLNLPKGAPSTMKGYKDMIYLLALMKEINYYFDQDGVFYLFDKIQQSQILQEKNNQVFNFIQNQIGVFVLFIMEILLILSIVHKMANNYLISVGTTNKFQSCFRKNYKNLENCIDQLRKFTKQSVFQIVKPKAVNYQQLKQKKQYTVKSLSIPKQKNATTLGKYETSESRLKKEASIFRSQKNIEKAQKTCMMGFHMEYLKYPAIRWIFQAIVLIVIFNSNRAKVENLQIYSNGISDLTFMNLYSIDLMALNLFYTNIKMFQQMSGMYQNSDQVARQFNLVASYVLSFDKIKIVSEMFVSNPDNEEIVNKILYRNLCKQFPTEMNCPQYMISKVDGLVQKYSEMIKNFNVLHNRLIAANQTLYGTLDTVSFQNRFIQSYENLNEALYLSKRVKTISFKILLQSMQFNSGSQSSPSDTFVYRQSQIQYPSWTALIFIFLFVQAAAMLSKLYSEGRIMEEEFLKLGNWEMFQAEKILYQGYGKYFSQAQQREWVAITLQI